MKQQAVFNLGPWAPDLPSLRLKGGLTTCTNVIPVAGGYKPFPSYSAIGSDPLSAEPQAVVWGQTSIGHNWYVAATQDTIEKHSTGGWTDISRSAGYNTGETNRWSGARFGSSAFFTNKIDPLQGADMESGASMADVADPAGGLDVPPRASVIAASENFLWLGDLVGGSGFDFSNSVGWSGINAPYYWPNPLSNAATQVLSGRQVLEGDGGVVKGILAGAEVTAIFQENAIHRADFVGNDLVWRFQRLETNHGLLVRNACVAYERRALYLSRDGFRMFDYVSTQNVGKDVVNDWFFNEWDSDYPESVTMYNDPKQTRVFISFAATDATNGVANRILIWDYSLNQWSVIEPGDHYLLTNAGSLAADLDSPDIPVTDPDILGTDPGDGSDTGPPGDESFDQVERGANDIDIGTFNTSFIMGGFTGTPLIGDLVTGDLELAPGRRSMLTGVRPHCDGADATVFVDSIPRRGSFAPSYSWTAATANLTTGLWQCREDGRYHRVRFIFGGLTGVVFTDFQCEYRPTGTR